MSAFSVTNEPCKCRLVEWLAEDPVKPIVFDIKTNEYHLKYTGGLITLYHCFLCGGKLPESQRESLFYVITDDEKRRLYELTKDIKTIDAAISALGQPDYEYPETVTDLTPEHTKPKTTRTFRCLVYLGLSETANVIISDRQELGVKIYFQEKNIKTKNENA